MQVMRESKEREQEVEEEERKNEGPKVWWSPGQWSALSFGYGCLAGASPLGLLGSNMGEGLEGRLAGQHEKPLGQHVQAKCSATPS